MPDENNMPALQEEVKQMKLRELETLRSFREMQDFVTELNQRWQVTHVNCCLFYGEDLKGRFVFCYCFFNHFVMRVFSSITCPAVAAQVAAAATGRNRQRRTP